MPLEKLIEHFGNSYGQYLYEASRGIDDSPLITHWEPKSISRETTFQEDVKNWQVIARTLAELTKEVVADMRDEGYRAKTVTIKIRFGDFQTLTRAKTMADYTDSEDEIRKAAFACLKRIELTKRVRLIGVRATKSRKSSGLKIHIFYHLGVKLKWQGRPVFLHPVSYQRYNIPHFVVFFY